MSPCGYCEHWPALRNQRPEDPVRHIGELLDQRIAAAGRIRRFGQWSYCWLLYRPARWIRRTFNTVINAFATSPVKTTTDVLTGAPIALLAWPPFREWTVRHLWASIALGVLIAFRVGYTVYRRNASKQEGRQSVRHTQTLALVPIELVLRHTLDAQRGYVLGPQLLPIAVRTLLDTMILFTRHGLKIPRNVTLHANLMLTMDVVLEDGTLAQGLGIVEYDNHAPATPSWTKVIKGDLIAGTVLETGKVEVVEDTRDPVWWGIYHGVRSRSFATFPITAPDRSIVGVVNLDADRPMIFRRADVVQQLWPVLAPPLRLMAYLLEASR
jgi:hypothetical protein